MNRLLLIIISALALGQAIHCRNAETVQVTHQHYEQRQATPAVTVPNAAMDRSQIPERFRWDISQLFENDARFVAGLEQARSQRQELEACRGSLSEPRRLQECLDLYFRARLLTNRCTLYAALQQSVDSESSEVQARVERSQGAMNDLMTLASNFRGEILAIDEEALTRSFEAIPELRQYEFYLHQIRRRRDTVLGEEAERVLSLAGDNLWAEIDLNEIPSHHERAFSALVSEIPLPEITDESGQKIQLTFSNYARYRGSSDRRVRRETVEGLFSALRSFDGTFAALLAGQANFSVFLARSRGYETAVDAYLLKDDIDPNIYRNLIRSVEANTEPLQRYMRFRQSQMGVDELHVYDLYTPLVPVVERTFPFEEASETIIEAMEPLGEEYLTVLREGINPENGWLDLYPHLQRESGAFSANVYGLHPYVFMNYYETLSDVLTLAHEYGHAIHSHYAMENQPYISYAYVPVIAETASTFNEVLVIRHLIEEASNDDERLYLLGQLVEMIRTTIYRQALFASFELALHTAVEGGTPVTAAFLEETYKTLLRRYYGESLTLGENDGMEWAYIPHFYYKYYVYSYAVGLCSGIALGDRVLAGGQDERDAYLGMLAAGNSRPPLEILRSAGVDPSDPHVVEAAARLMDESLSQMEAIIARRGQ